MKSKVLALIPNDADVCSTRDAASILGVSLRTAQMWVEQGQLEAWKTPGGHRRIKLRSVEALAQKRAGESGPFRVLVVEDDEDLLDLYLAQIEQWGFPVQVDSALNGLEGLIKIGENLPNILITDLNMPEIDGIQMIRTLNGKYGSDKFHIVVVTALSEQEVSARGGLPAGVSLMRKPLSFDQLKGYLQACLAMAKETNAVQAETRAAV
ncbi:MAG: response regulator [Burkholderiales bacterium]|nr:response regulator [Burkholderiales bacterium]